MNFLIRNGLSGVPVLNAIKNPCLQDINTENTVNVYDALIAAYAKLIRSATKIGQFAAQFCRGRYF